MSRLNIRCASVWSGALQRCLCGQLVLRMIHQREAIFGEARRKWIETLTSRIRLKPG